MRRLLYVGIILALVAGGVVFSIMHTDAVTKNMIDTLHSAYDAVEADDFDQALIHLDEFDDIYRRNEAFFILFVRRDLVYNVQASSASLRDYANEITKKDFLADLMRTIEHIEIIRFNIIRIA